MRSRRPSFESRFSLVLAGSLAVACSSSNGSGFPSASPDASALLDGQVGSADVGQVLGVPDAGGVTTSVDGGTATSVITIYANTDDSLYTLDPKTNAVSLVGKFTGLGGGSDDDSATDVAVNAEGVVYVNSESVIYKATLPTGGSGSVALAKVASIALKSSQKFYALAFAPVGTLGAGETLVGGDGNGELWSIDTTTGATRDLGNFGPNPDKPSDILALSGDIVFYKGADGSPTGLATIRSCSKSGSSCTKTDDYLAGIDMTALVAAYTSGTPATSLLSGIYGGGSGTAGAGTGFAELFGLGAWEGNVYGFGRSQGSSPPDLVTISPTTGAGTVLSSAFGFTNGWSGAGVTTTTTVTIAAPPVVK